MDYRIVSLTKNYLRDNLSSFISILKNEKYEYWDENNFLTTKPLKYKISLIALAEKDLLGYIIASQKNEFAYIHKFMVDERYRSNNIGSKLLKEFEEIALNFRLFKAQLTMIAENTKALNFYTRNNYNLISSRMDVKNNIELLLLEKNLI